jgi:hypothetical protein
MKTTGLFKCHIYKIHVETINDVINIVPFGDIHRFAPLCNVEKWYESIERMKSLDHDNTYFLGMGDYDDLMSASERAVFDNPKIHESTRETLDDFASAKTFELAKELDFMKGRIIGMLGGNHYYEFPSGMTSDHKLCEHLNTTYLGVSSVIRLSVSQGKRGSSSSLDIWAHHGMGASRLVGGSINRVEQMREGMHCDVYLMGHDHQRAAVPVDLLVPSGGGAGVFRVKRKTQWLCRTGSFLNAYQDGKASYIVDAARGPVNQGHIELQVSLNREEIKPTKAGRKRSDSLSLSVKALV